MTQSRVLVIDASVLQSAGKTEHPVSKSCRDALTSILKICHRIVSTPDIREEWRRHTSKFSRIWFRSMMAHKKVVPCSSTTPLAIDTNNLTQNEIVELEKDKRLLEAALVAERIIVTRDDKIQKILAKTQKGAHFVTDMEWIDPVTGGCAALERLSQ